MPEPIPPNELIKDLTQVTLHTKSDEIILTICLTMQKAYEEGFTEHSVTLPFEEDFTGGRTIIYSRDLLVKGCKAPAKAHDLLTDARAAEKSESRPYYLYRSHACYPESDAAGFTVGCFINPKQKFDQLTLVLEPPDYQYINHSAYRLLYPVAWLIDALLAPFYVIAGGALIVLWGMGGSSVPGLP